MSTLTFLRCERIEKSILPLNESSTRPYCIDMTNTPGPAPTFGITEQQIDKLSVEAAAAGDWLQVAICDLARGVPISKTTTAAKDCRVLRAYGYSINPNYVFNADIVRAWASCAATILGVATLE